MSEQTRKEFEAWAESKKWCILKTDGVYNNTIVGCAFEAWQASRESIVVELPEAEGWTDDGAYSFAVDLRDIQQSLSDAGVSYK